MDRAVLHERKDTPRGSTLPADPVASDDFHLGLVTRSGALFLCLSRDYLDGKMWGSSGLVGQFFGLQNECFICPITGH